MHPFDPTSEMPVALIGDIHGCSAELRELLELVRPRRIVSLGDVLDRGPDPAGCVELLRRAGADVVLGNHEDKHFRFRAHEARRRRDPSYENPMQLGVHHQETQTALSDGDWGWLESRCVPHLRLAEHRVLAVHAGLSAHLPPERHRADRICRVQMTRPDRADRSSPWGGWIRGPSGEPVLVPKKSASLEEGYRWWTEFRTSDQDVVIYGHSVMPSPLLSFERHGHVTHSFAEAGASVDRDGLVAIGIDTGAPFGGALTALCLPEWTFVSVRAKARYFEHGHDEE